MTPGPVLERTWVQIAGLSNPHRPVCISAFLLSWSSVKDHGGCCSIDENRDLRLTNQTLQNIFTQIFPQISELRDLLFWFGPHLSTLRASKKAFQSRFIQMSAESEPTLSHSRLKIILHALLCRLFWTFSFTYTRRRQKPEHKYPACQLTSHWCTSFISPPSFSFPKPFLWTHRRD